MIITFYKIQQPYNILDQNATPSSSENRQLFYTNRVSKYSESYMSTRASQLQSSIANVTEKNGIFCREQIDKALLYENCVFFPSDGSILRSNGI